MFKKVRFRHQLSFIYGIGIVLIVLMTTLVITKVSTQAMRERIIAEGLKLTETLGEESTLALLYESEDNAMEAAHIFMAFPDVQGVEIINADLSTLYREGDFAESPLNPKKLPTEVQLVEEYVNTWAFVAPVKTGKQEFYDPLSGDDPDKNPQVVGYVKMVHSKEALKKMTSNILLYNLVLSSGLAALLLIFLSMLAYRLTRPIQRLATTMSLAERGELDQRANLEGPRDIIEMQSAFNTMMEKLEEREGELKFARDQANESARIKAEFAANVSHELRTPMNGVLGMLELLSDYNLSEEQSQHINIAKNSAQSLLRLIDNVLDFSKNDMGKATIELRNFHLDEDIGEIVSLLGSQARKKQLDLVYIVDPKMPQILVGDNHRIRQILLNLTGNALKFTQNGSVSIVVSSISKDEDRIILRFEVRDTGIGISDEQQKLIFKAFSQADSSTTRKFGGTGLGLAISRQLIEQMGGEIGVDSQPGEGSTFWFTLPLGYEAVEARPLSVGQGQPEIQRILIVDNNEMVLQSLERFATAEGYQYQSAKSYDLAVILLEQSLNQTPFDILLISENLDGDGGTRLAHHIDQHQSYKNIRVFMMGYRAVTKEHSAFEGVDGYISKPLTRLHFVNRFNTAHDVSKFGVASSSSDKVASDAVISNFTDKHLLVVEDNIVNQQVALGLLKPFGCEVDVVDNGQECLAKMSQKDYDLILMDCHMPVMDGYEATRRIREMEEDNRIPVVAMTANVMEGESDKCFEAGMDDYLPKPLTRDGFNKVLARWLSDKENLPLSENVENKDQPRGENVGETALAIDKKVMMELTEMMGSDMPMLVDRFIETLVQNLEVLEGAIEQKNAGQVRLLSHNIKGSVGHFGARVLVEMTQQLENQAKQGILDGAVENFKEIKKESAIVIESVREFGYGSESARMQTGSN